MSVLYCIDVCQNLGMCPKRADLEQVYKRDLHQRFYHAQYEWNVQYNKRRFDFASAGESYLEFKYE